MRIAYLAPEAFPIPPVRGGSVEHCVDRISRCLSKHHAVTVVGRTDPSLPMRSRSGNIEYRRINPRSRGGYLKAAVRELSKITFDLLQVDNRPQFLPVLRKSFPDQKLVLALHSMNFLLPPLIKADQARQAVNEAEAIIVNSDFVRRELISAFPRAGGRVWVVRPGVDIRQFPFRFSNSGLLARRAARRKLHLGKRPAVFFAGRIIPRKGLHNLIRAMAIVREELPLATLVLAGRTKSLRTGKTKPYPARLADLAAKLNVPIIWAGFIPPSRIAESYVAADVVACPSEKDEALGLINLEAMACGIPVVASRIGGIPEAVVNEETGFLVSDFCNPEAWVKPLVQLLNRPALASEMGRRARQAAETLFSWERVGEELERVYEFVRGKPRH